MQARLIVYPPDNAAIARWLEPGASLRVGRTRDCDLSIDHATVSRRHAELAGDGDGWTLRDLASKNGSFVDGQRIADATVVASNCWLRFGDVHCELQVFAPEVAARLRERERQHQARSTAMTQRLARVEPNFGALLDDTLAGVLELTGCDRGFLLVMRNGELRVRAGSGAHAGDFAGSAGAVQRALAQRQSLVVNHVAGEPWLASRASVADMQLRSLVCIPLLDGERTIGAVYADRRNEGDPITDLDIELLQAFCERAAVWLLAGNALDAIESTPRWNTLVSGRIDGAPA